MHDQLIEAAEFQGKLSSASVPIIPSATLRALRNLLLETGYSSAEAGEETHALDIVRRLFARRETVAKAAAESFMGARLLNELIESNLLEEHGPSLRAGFQIKSEAGLFFLSDFTKQEVRSDLVLPIGPSAKHLAHLTIRRKVRSALDLGCGCGIQALLAARHADLVTATDINPRALAITRLNAELNNIANIEIIEGSYFEPVRGRTFDLIVANPPYVVAPRREYIYRDAGEPGDASVRKMLLETPQYLTEGGFAQVMISWIERAGEPWWALAKDMLQCAGTDSCLMHNSTKTPEQYAALWISIDAKQEPEKYSNEIAKWTDWYRAQGYHQFALGSITMRRRTQAKNWSTAVEVKKHLSESLGEEVFQLFENQDALEHQADLLQARFVARNMEIDARTRLARTARGFLFQVRISAHTINVLEKLRKGITLGEALKGGFWQKGSLEDRQHTLQHITQLLNFGMLELIQ